jgi:hypothetical protein
MNKNRFRAAVGKGKAKEVFDFQLKAGERTTAPLPAG